MDFNKLIKLLVAKKYEEAYELTIEMRDTFKARCRNGEYTNIEMARRDWRRLYGYYDTASTLYVRKKHDETKQFEQTCKRIVEIVKEGLIGEG